jgi:release factor glutamine methyltransferase
LTEPATKSAAPARTVEALLAWAAAELGANSEDAKADALALLEASAGIGKAQAYARPAMTVPTEAVRFFERATARRAGGEPVSYIVGSRGFHALELDVCRHVLIPRPETEILVNEVIARAPESRAFTVLDLGTGSGAIALAVAHACPFASVCAVDVSSAALETAHANARKLGIDVEWLESDWYGALDGRRFDFIVSNPPYVRSDDPHMAELVYEPRLALDGGADGLASLRKVLAAAAAHLRPNGWLLVEHGFDQASSVAAIASTCALTVWETIVDLGGHERVTVMQAAP